MRQGNVIVENKCYSCVGINFQYVFRNALLHIVVKFPTEISFVLGLKVGSTLYKWRTLRVWPISRFAGKPVMSANHYCILNFRYAFTMAIALGVLSQKNLQLSTSSYLFDINEETMSS